MWIFRLVILKIAAKLLVHKSNPYFFYFPYQWDYCVEFQLHYQNELASAIFHDLEFKKISLSNNKNWCFTKHFDIKIGMLDFFSSNQTVPNFLCVPSVKQNGTIDFFKFWNNFCIKITSRDKLNFKQNVIKPSLSNLLNRKWFHRIQVYKNI